MAPELLNTEGLTNEILKNPSRDIFALGCTMVEVFKSLELYTLKLNSTFQILTLQLPFHDQKTDYAVLACLMTGKRPSRPDSIWCTDAIWQIITHCWAQEPTDRPSAREVYEALQQPL